MSVASVKKDGQITRILLNRPERLNAFNADLVAALTDAVAKANRDGTRLLVFRGEGKGFSGGFDLSDLDRASDGDLLLRFVRVEELLLADARLLVECWMVRIQAKRECGVGGYLQGVARGSFGAVFDGKWKYGAEFDGGACFSMESGNMVRNSTGIRVF